MTRRPLLFVVGLAAAVRLLLLFAGPWHTLPAVLTDVTTDAPRYVLLADNLLAGRGFAKRFEEGTVHLAVERLLRANGTLPQPNAGGWTAEGFRTPGYPLLVAACGGSAGLRAVLLFQCLFGAIAAGLVVKLASNIGFGPRRAVLAGGLWALHPALVSTDCMLYTESTFTSLAVAGLYLTTATTTPRGRLLAGLVLGLTGLIRPIGLLYLPTAVLLGWPAASRKWLCAAALSVAAILPSAGWAVRNITSGFGPRVSTVGEINLYFYGVAYVRAETRGEDWSASWPAKVRELTDELEPTLTQGADVFAAMRSKATSELKANPAATAKVAAKSQVKLTLDHSLDVVVGFFGRTLERSGLFAALLAGKVEAKQLTPLQLIAVGWMGANAVLVALAAMGLARFALARRWGLLLACAIPVALFSAASFPVGLERFRVPFVLFLVLPAAAAFRPRPPARA